MTVDSANVDLLQLIPTRLKKVANTNGGEYHGVCPFCGGTDRFIVNPTPRAGNPSWMCRKCGLKGDAITYVMQKHNLNFVEALDFLKLESTAPQQRRESGTVKPTIALTPEDNSKAFLSEEWQQNAEDFVNWSVEQLASGWGKGAREYLRARGIPENNGINDLGYNPENTSMFWGETKVYLLRGIVIPWEIGGQFWRIRFRISPKDLKPGDDKYKQVAGCGNGLYGAGLVSSTYPVIVVEGEFDALLINHLTKRARLNVVAVAIGGTNNARLLRWVSLLSIAPVVLLAMDDDELDPDTYTKAGDMSALWWQGVLKTKVKRLRPESHDVTDMWKEGKDIVGWIKRGLQNV